MKPYSQENIQKELEQKGCKLLSDCQGTKIKFSFLCGCGNIGKLDLEHFRRGHRCGLCKSKRRRKYTLEEVSKIFSDKGCRLLSTKYESSNTPLEYECSCGAKSNICLKAFFRQKQKCRWCGIQKISGNKNYQWIADRTKFKSDKIFGKRCRNILTRALKGKYLDPHLERLLGYTLKVLIEHLGKSGNLTPGQSEIDHIFPVKAFIDTGIYDFSLINSLSNLRVCSVSLNRKKSAIYDKLAFKAWLEKVQ